jgi:hypothetical protein
VPAITQCVNIKRFETICLQGEVVGTKIDVIADFSQLFSRQKETGPHIHPDYVFGPIFKYQKVRRVCYQAASSDQACRVSQNKNTAHPPTFNSFKKEKSR